MSECYILGKGRGEHKRMDAQRGLENMKGKVYIQGIEWYEGWKGGRIGSQRYQGPRHLNERNWKPLEDSQPPF